MIGLFLIKYTSLSSIFFFFQAEDGIRDPLVTGVQTCALPILVDDGIRHRMQIVRDLYADVHGMRRAFPHVRGHTHRSEIGRASCRKECRSRWATYHEKKKREREKMSR